jgi:ATP-dependent Clp protease ATP-binding subunit ClpA
MGARPMDRLIQEKLKKPLADEVLFGQLTQGGGTVEVTVVEDALSLSIKTDELVEA